MKQRRRDTRQQPIRVTLLAVPESTPAALFGLFEVLSSAGVVWPTLVGGEAGAPAFEVRIASIGAEVFQCTGGVPISPHAAISDIDDSEIVIVTDVSLPIGIDPRERWPEANIWLRQQYDRGAVVSSICTGSILLANAGLLDEREATTHWSAAGLFETYFPKVKLRPERILVPSGDAHRLITSGGASSWEDLALYLIARHCGQDEAVRTAKVFLFGDRSEGQLPYAAAGRPRRHPDAAIAAIQEWAVDHYNDAHVVTRMVAQAGLPERTFKRRFKAATGYSPIDYIQNLRVEEAKQILETTDEATENVGRAVGYEDPTFFRRLFKRRTGTTPARYRLRFKNIGKIVAD